MEKTMKIRICDFCKSSIRNTKTSRIQCVICGKDSCGEEDCKGIAPTRETIKHMPYGADNLPFICSECWNAAGKQKVAIAPDVVCSGGTAWSIELGNFAHMTFKECNKIYIQKMIAEIERMRNK